jgi:DNA-directed RNA polymerase sigma subunit (sigma70/sigma32)
MKLPRDVRGDDLARRLRQIETKALNKLRHPSRRKKLIEFME